jgi:hypothetical protein
MKFHGTLPDPTLVGIDSDFTPNRVNSVRKDTEILHDVNETRQGQKDARTTSLTIRKLVV